LFCSLASVVCRRRLSGSVTLPAGGRASRRVGGRAADTARRASTVTLRQSDTLFVVVCNAVHHVSRRTPDVAVVVLAVVVAAGPSV